MTDYNLSSNEGIICKCDNVTYGSGFKATALNELVLTNQNIIFVKKSAFGKVRDVIKYPLHSIKIVNDVPRVLLGRKAGMPMLEVYFRSGAEEFGIGSKVEINKWIDSIRLLIAGHEVEPVDASGDTYGLGAIKEKRSLRKLMKKKRVKKGINRFE